MSKKGGKDQKTGTDPIGLSRAEDAEVRCHAENMRHGSADLRKKASGLRQSTADQRDRIADQREKIADQREGFADQREKTADLRDELIDQREETSDLRDELIDQRKHAADMRQGSADLRKKASGLRQSTADQREDTANLRQNAADQREDADTAKAKQSTITKALLKEANERLILSSVHAQTMAESARLAAKIASHDYLTGLPNRLLLNDRMAQSIALAERHKKKVALLFLDLDHFKHINDSHGHAVGDELLKSIAKRLQTCVRHSDTVCRQGGDEFVVLLNEVEEVQDAVLMAGKIIEAMGRPHLISGSHLDVTFSIGISIYPDDGKDLETVARKADVAMYHAKKKGRNTYQIFIDEMDARTLAQQSMEQKLHHALEQNRFVLHYQTKVNLETGSITGVEALIRLRESDNQLIYPEHFISIAEDCGLILPIGRWVLHEACRQTQEWLQAGFDIGHIAVNVSSREFHSQGFLAGVISVLNETGLDPHYLELEITESGLMEDTEQMMTTFSVLKELGVRIAIDDFGTGHSSLSYLARFPLDTLKIDQSFVQNLDDASSDTDNIIISAVIAMGESLKHRVVAEGIETKQQLAFLQSKRCAEGQGYYYSRPVAAEVLTASMATTF
jgi:diguanylate cyclase (GGDEF)-like protein